MEGDLGHQCRQGEHDVEVRHRQQLGLSGGEPLGARPPLALRAMPVAARVIGAADQAALGAGLGVPAQRRRSAQFNRAHHSPLDAAQVTVVQAAIRLAVAAEDIRHFQAGRHEAAGSGRRHDLQVQPVERAFGPPDQPVRDLAYSAPCSTGWHGPTAPE